jgi:putative transposase
MATHHQAAAVTAERATTAALAARTVSRRRATWLRLDHASRAFFRRLTSSETPGYSRFKGRKRIDTIEFPSCGDGCKLDGSLVYVPRSGWVKMNLRRPVEGAIKTISFKREADGWRVVFSCASPGADVAPSPLPSPSSPYR